MPERAARHMKHFIGRVRRSDFATFADFVHSASFSWILLLVLSAGVAFLTSVSLQYIPSQLQEGMIAVRNIKADRGYEIVDAEATEKFQKDAASGVMAVYDYDPRLLDALVGRVQETFELLRVRYGELTRDENGRRIALSEEGTRELKTTFSDRLDLTPTAAQWKALVTERFSERCGEDLVLLLREAMAGPIIAERGALDTPKETGGVVLRTFKPPKEEGTERVAEDRVVTDLATIRTLESARKRIADVDIPRTGLRGRETIAAVRGIARELVVANTFLNHTETQRRREMAAADVKPVILKVKPGEMIIREGARYEPWHIKVLTGIQTEKRSGTAWLQFLGTFVIVLLFLLLPFYLAERFFRRIRPTRSDHFLMALVGFSILIVVRLSLIIAPALHDVLFFDIPTTALAYAIPVAAGAMLIRMYLGAEISLIFAVVISVLTGLFVETDVQFVVYCLAANFAAIVSIARVDRRSLIIRAGAITGGVGAVAVFGMQLVAMAAGSGAVGWVAVLWSTFFAFLAGLGAAIYTMIAAAIVESLSGYTSDIKLLELANLNHPLLRELIVRAPGTYHHSHLVGILGEAAADAIGANSLLVRVGAYYHDIGKIKKPPYFIENVRGGDSRHEKLSPNMSALIVQAHVKDGIEMAAKSNIPKVISEMIPQHHGTRIISYFYDKAKSQEDPDLQKVDEKDFRYPGPKPQTREAAILMLADVTEAAVRSLKEKSSIRIQQTVQRAINDIFAESQLDECDLTLRDLNEIAKAFVRILLGIYHQRIEYPKDKEPEKNGKPEISVVDEDTVREESGDESPSPSTSPAEKD